MFDPLTARKLEEEIEVREKEAVEMKCEIKELKERICRLEALLVKLEWKLTPVIAR